MDYEYLDAILKERHISRRKLALTCGIPESTMSTIFSRRPETVSVDIIKKIAACLDVNPAFIMFGPLKDETPPAEETKLDQIITLLQSIDRKLNALF